MATTTTVSPVLRDPELLGQTVVVIGGSAGIGLETARRARAEGADVILTGRNRERLQQPARELGEATPRRALAAPAPPPSTEARRQRHVQHDERSRSGLRDAQRKR